MKETFAYTDILNRKPIYKANGREKNLELHPFLKDMGPNWIKWKSSRFLPKWAARIWLEVTGVKVERVQDISIKDAFAEGVSTQQASHAQPFFQSLWDSLNAKRGYSWKSNPWVWVYEFKRSK